MTGRDSPICVASVEVAIAERVAKMGAQGLGMGRSLRRPRASGLRRSLSGPR